MGHVSAACGASTVVSGLPLNPSTLREDQRGKGVTHENKSARKILPPSTDNVMLVCHSAIDDDPAKSAALAVEKINTLSHNIGIEKVALVASHKTGGKHTGMVSARVSKLLSQEEADKITKDFHLIHVGHADITHFQAFALDYEKGADAAGQALETLHRLDVRVLPHDRRWHAGDLNR